MSINLLDLVREQVTGVLTKEAATYLGESEADISKALGGMMPAFLASTIEKASTSNGAAAVMDSIDKLNLEHLNNISGIFKGNTSGLNSLMGSGGSILDMLWGNKTAGVINFMTNMTGLNAEVLGKLLKLAAPFFLSIVGKHVQGKGIGVIRELMLGQKSYVTNALPAGMGTILGYTIETGYRGTNSSSSSTSRSDGENINWMRWLIAAILLLGTIWFAQKCMKEKSDLQEAAVRAKIIQDSIAKAAIILKNEEAKKKESVVSQTETVKSKFETVDLAAKAILSKLKMDSESATGKILSYIDRDFDGEAVFRFKYLNFDSGSSKMDVAAKTEVDHLAFLLKAYPAVTVEINGHTDNVGDAAKNKALSSDRANAVIARLIDKGINKSRLTANGYGQQQPIGDNGTKEGKALNRRIEIKVVQ